MGVGLLRLWVEFYLLPPVCINPKPLSFIIGNADIDAPSSHLPTSPQIGPVLNVGPVSADTEMTACEIPLWQFAIKLILIFINLNLTVNQVEGCVEGAIDILQCTSPILTGSYFLQIFIFYFW